MLDKFMPAGTPPPKVEERCDSCRKLLTSKVVKYTLTKGDKTRKFCQKCAKRELRPQENYEGDL